MKRKTDNIPYIKLFILIVLFAAFVSLAYKAFLLVKNRSFRFSTYNIMLIGRNANIASFNTQKKEIRLIEFKNGREFSRYKVLTASMKSSIPLDGMIISIIPQNLTRPSDDFPTFAQTLSFLLADEKYVFYNINKFDLVKLYLVSKLTKWERVYEEPQGKFYDTDIFNEKTSIEIINSTEINGLGAKLSLVLSNLGVNVISVKDGEEKKTQILAKDQNKKTLKRIERLFELKAEKSQGSDIADITINLGKDRKWE